MKSKVNFGWVNYFSSADMKTLLQKMDVWYEDVSVWLYGTLEENINQIEEFAKTRS